MLVKIVTPSSAGRFLRRATASWAARIMAEPPSVCSQQADPRQVRSRGHRPGYGIGNVVKLQVEEDPEAQTRELLKGSRAFCCE